MAEFETLVGKDFPSIFTGYLLNFEGAVASASSKLAVAMDINAKYGSLPDGRKSMLAWLFPFLDVDPTKKLAKAGRLWGQKYADRLLKIIFVAPKQNDKGYAQLIWKSVMEHQTGDNLERKEEIALYVLSALTIYHPKVIHPLRFMRRTKEMLKDHYTKDGVKAENQQRKKDLDAAMDKESLKISKETKQLVQEYWEQARKKSMTALEMRMNEGQVMEVPDQGEDEEDGAMLSPVELEKREVENLKNRPKLHKLLGDDAVKHANGLVDDLSEKKRLLVIVCMIKIWTY